MGVFGSEGTYLLMLCIVFIILADCSVDVGIDVFFFFVL